MAEILAQLRASLSDRYRIERELGAGGMATVYLAEDLKHHRKVAIKVLRPELAAALGPERFLREITVTAQLNHPNILPLLDSGMVAPAGNADGQPYYVMPFVEGESLRDRLDREKQLPLGDAMAIARELSDALNYAHSRGIIHRDIKPENILLSGGHARVADFGIARAIDEAGGESLTQTGMAIGTPAYMSPEQAAGDRNLDNRSDLYALGCVVYEMLAGEPPHTAPTARSMIAKQIAGTIQPLRVLRECVPEAVEAAVMRVLSRVPADRFSTASQFADALSDVGVPASTRKGVPKGSRRIRLTVISLMVITIMAVTALLWRSRPGPSLDPSLLAVVPFDVLDADFEVWHEGMVDLMSRNLDGAGPLRTVSPTVVMRRWKGRADPASAADLGHRTGAGLALFGSLMSAGPDSVRLQATLFDISKDRMVEEWELRDVTDRVDRLADSLTFRLLRRLGRSQPVAVQRLAGFGSTSLSALKAFLQGEQHLRRSQWDSALGFYLQAIEQDSGFALGLQRASSVLGWTKNGFDSVATSYMVRAAASNHGLAPRDSLLLVSDSVMASLLEAGPLGIRADTGWQGRLERLFGTLEHATTGYPDDPEAWYKRAEAYHHFGAFLGHSYEEELGAFDRSLALDSAFTPAYIHPIEVSLLYGADAGRVYLRRYLALSANDINTDGARLVERLLDAAPGSDAGQLSEGVSDHGLHMAMAALSRLPDSAEVATSLARFAASAPRTAPPLNIPGFAKAQAAQALIRRGHFREGLAILDESPALFHRLPFAEAAMFGAIAPNRAAVYFKALLSDDDPAMVALAFPWWSFHRDTSSLRAAGRSADSVARSQSNPTVRGRGRYVAAASAAYLALTLGDSAVALERFLALPRGLCPICYFDRLTTAQLLVEQGRDREAWGMLQGEYPTSTLVPYPSEILWVLLRGRVAERLGENERAIRSYSWVAGMWRDPDPELRAYTAEAREGLSRLTGEKP
ncbi:MAG: serine/threonine-protein kinase [Gemmatimonadota bacterium]